MIVPDLRGFAYSDKPDLPPDQGYNCEVVAREIEGFIAELGLERIAVVAHDIGATVAQPLARLFASRVARLVLLDPPYRHFLTHWSGRKPWVTEPKLELWGTEDPVLPFAWTDRLAEYFPKLAVKRVPAVGHFMMREVPGRTPRIHPDAYVDPQAAVIEEGAQVGGSPPRHAHALASCAHANSG